MKNITLKKDNNIGFLSFDLQGSKANKLSFEVLEELDFYLDEVIKDKSLKVLVIQSSKESIFIAGADIKEIEEFVDFDIAYKAILKADDIFHKLETLNVPTIAYINGACMGGGLELALCCNYRVATTNDKTKLAFPEVKLGFFPGLGGTQRAPKVIGLINALDIILTGKTLDAKKAYKIKLVDEIFHNGQKEFKLQSFIQRVLENKINKKYKFNINTLMENFTFTRNIIYKKTLQSLEKKVNKDFKGPYKALEVIEKTFGKDYKDGILIEAKEFCNLAITKESKYMINLFYTFEKFNKDFTKTNNPISKVTILGNGVMGKGIIWLFSKYLKEVRIKIRKIQQVQNILKDVAKLYDSLIKRRSMTKNEVEFKLNDISYTNKFNGLKSTQFVIEAIIEDEDAKKEAFKNLENILSKDSIIATNTSSISINTLAKELRNKKNFLGVHFFNPVNMMPLVEIIPNKETSLETINRVKELLVSCGKTPIVVGDCAGFIVNRILLPYINEAANILSEGSCIKEIDKVMKEFGMPMGPFSLADTVGIDIGYKVALILEQSYGERMKMSSLLEKVYLEKKLLGKKANKGFYLYEGKNINVNKDISTLQKTKKVINKKDILQRCLFVMINEASRCLSENIVQEAKIIDFAMITGTGFPPYKGGICSLANEYGISYIVEQLEAYSENYGEKFKPSKLLLALKENNLDFNTGGKLWKR